MKQVLKTKEKYSISAFNSKYMFYTDGKDRVHRVSKKNGKDIILSDLKVMDVECTEDGLFLQEYKAELLGSYFVSPASTGTGQRIFLAYILYAF